MRNERMTQEKMVAQHLRECGCITSWEAFEDYGVTRLSAIIYNLRKVGWNITSENLTIKNRYGNTTTVAKYVLEERK